MERVIKLLEEQNTLLRDLNDAIKGITPENHMMEAQEAAEYIKQKYETILRWAKEGKIPHSRPGRRVLFSKKALDEWLSEQEKASLKDGPIPPITYGKLRKIV